MQIWDHVASIFSITSVTMYRFGVYLVLISVVLMQYFLHHQESFLTNSAYSWGEVITSKKLSSFHTFQEIIPNKCVIPPNWFYRALVVLTKINLVKTLAILFHTFSVTLDYWPEIGVLHL